MSPLKDLREKLRTLRAERNLQAALIDALLVNGDLHEMALTAARALDGRITIVAADGSVLAMSEDQIDEDLHPALRLLDIAVPPDPVQIESGLWVSGMCVGDDYLGCIVLNPQGGPSEQHPAQLRLLSDTAARIVDRRGNLTDFRGHIRDNLLNSVLAQKSVDHDRPHLERAAHIGIDLEDPFVVAVVQSEQSLRCRVNLWASSYAAQVGGLRGTHNGDVVLLIPEGPQALPETISESLTRIARAELPVGISSAHLGTAGVREGCREARWCLEAAVALGAKKTATSPADLGFVGLMLSRDYDIPGYLTRVLGPVLDYDRTHRGELTATLHAYFATGSSPSRAAEQLHMHTNTVARRLHRISELLGEDWKDPDPALEIQLALRLLSVQDTLTLSRSERDPAATAS